MTDAELEQLYADRAFAERQLHRHQRSVELWEKRRYDLSKRIYEAMKDSTEEFTRQVKEG